MVSAGCPDCRIIVAEANADWSRGGRALAYALQMGAEVVTISYTWGEPSSILNGDAWLDFPRVSVFAASGDTGYGNPSAGG